ncbi:MAG TPA: tRNA dihydrouridine synthase DusB [Candidatus Dormibacteraeota bacterium]|nr:tRNA dihydrouridine synthase DusB [Candidatus Dormibacteraeota bacterium]
MTSTALPPRAAPARGSSAGLKIGGIELSTPIFIAPMVGITDRPFRAFAREMGVGLTCTEMTAAAALVRAPEGVAARLLDLGEEEDPVAAQLVGNDPQLMADAAQLCVQLGADLVDVNLGCPVPKVVRLGSGAALAREIPRTVAVLEAMVAAVDVPVTAKMRLGWDHQTINAAELSRALEDVGVAAITVHGRTRCQKYTGLADWDQIARVKEAVRQIPVLGSGDVRDSKLIEDRIRAGAVDGVVVARGMLGDWTFLEQTVSQLRWGDPGQSPDFESRLRLAKRHWDAMVAHHGEQRGVRLSRKFVVWAIKGCAGAARLRARVAELFTQADLDQLFLDILVAGEGPDGWHLPNFTSGEG